MTLHSHWRNIWQITLSKRNYSNKRSSAVFRFQEHIEQKPTPELVAPAVTNKSSITVGSGAGGDLVFSQAAALNVRASRTSVLKHALNSLVTDGLTTQLPVG